MNADEVRKILKEDFVEVLFKKKDGSLREMFCTLIPEAIPEGISTGNAISNEVITVWDLEAKGWRSFRLDSVIWMEFEDESGNLRREEFS